MQGNDALVKVCQAIAQEGLTPGVGLLRARAPFKVSIAQAIEAIKVYKQGRPVPSESATTPAAPPTLESRVATLEQRIDQLEVLVQQALSTHSG